MTMLALRTTVKPDIGASPSDLVYGEGISIPGQLAGPPQLNEMCNKKYLTKNFEEMVLKNQLDNLKKTAN